MNTLVETKKKSWIEHKMFSKHIRTLFFTILARNLVDTTGVPGLGFHSMNFYFAGEQSDINFKLLYIKQCDSV